MCDSKKKKQYLESYQELVLEFKREIEDAEYWRNMAYGVRASTLDESGVTKTSMSNFQPIDKYLEISERCIKRAQDIEKKKINILKAIKEIETPLYRKVLSLRYIDDYSFHHISQKLFLNQNYIYHVHNRALKCFKIPKEDKKCQL